MKGILPDKEIRKTIFIEPFNEGFKRLGIISYGLSSFGYDIRLAPEYKVFTDVFNTLVDPKAFDPHCFVEFEGPSCIIPPNSFALGYSIEKFKVPRDVLAICVGKSTYARCGIIVNITPLEPEWEGHITLEISNTTPLPAKIYGNEGICQILFFRGEEECQTSYRDKQGKYQDQKPEIVLPKVS